MVQKMSFTKVAFCGKPPPPPPGHLGPGSRGREGKRERPLAAYLGEG